jgi:hypothetical protein
MAAVSETIVREYFELHGFLTRQERKYVARGKQEKDGIDFFCLEPATARAPIAGPIYIDDRRFGGGDARHRGGARLAYGVVWSGGAGEIAGDV